MDARLERSFSVPNKLSLRVPSHVSQRTAYILPSITCMTSSIQKSCLFAGRLNGQIAVFRFDPLSGVNVDAPFVTLNGHEARISTMYFSEQFGLLFTGSVDGSIRVWDPFVLDAKDLCIQVISSHSRAISGLAVHEAMLVSSSIDGRAVAYQTDTRKRGALVYPWFYEVQVMEGRFDGWVSSLAASPVRRVGEAADLVVGTSDGKLVLFVSEPVPFADTGISFRFNYLKTHTDLHKLAVTFVLLLIKENMIVTICNDKTVRILESISGKPFFTLQNPRGRLFVHCDWNENSKELLLLDDSAHVEVWKYDIGSLIFSKKLSHLPLHVVKWFPDDDDRFFVGGTLGVSQYRLSREVGAKKMEGHSEGIMFIKRLDLAVHEQRLYTVGLDRKTIQWVVFDEGLNLLNTRMETKSDITGFHCWVVEDMSIFVAKEFRQKEATYDDDMSTSTKRLFVFSGHEDGTIRALFAGNDRSFDIKAHQNSVTSIAGALKYWNARDRQLVPCPHIASVGYDGCLGFWKIEMSGGLPYLDCLDFVRISDSELLTVLVNSSNNTYITGGNDTIIRVFSARGPELHLVHKLEGHEGPISVLERDGNFLFSSGVEKSILVWDLHSGTCLRKLSGHTGEITGITMLDSVGFLVSCSLDGSLAKWHYPSGRLVKKFNRQEKFTCMDYDSAYNVMYIGTASGALLQVDLESVSEVDDNAPIIPTSENSARPRTSFQRVSFATARMKLMSAASSEITDRRSTVSGNDLNSSSMEIRRGLNVRRTITLAPAN
eukprot:ANDGO_06284.mRNA.1 F-box/WD repeat-containing protein sel-10